MASQNLLTRSDICINHAQLRKHILKTLTTRQNLTLTFILILSLFTVSSGNSDDSIENSSISKMKSWPTNGQNRSIATVSYSQSPTLKISLRQDASSDLPEKVSISITEIAKALKEETFTVKEHPVYDNTTVTYAGYYFKDVINYLASKLQIKNTSDLVFSIWSSDNFSAFVTNEDLMSGTAFFAIREINSENKKSLKTADGLWTSIEKHGSPGPFYLVWDNPKDTYWQKWPFKIVEITFVSKALKSRFDKISPGDDFMETKGYRLVLNNCTSCHQVAGVGLGNMGPDLKALGQFRSEKDFNKQIRTPKGRMISFPETVLSDEDIKAMYLYLRSIK